MLVGVSPCTDSLPLLLLVRDLLRLLALPAVLLPPLPPLTLFRCLLRSMFAVDLRFIITTSSKCAAEVLLALLWWLGAGVARDAGQSSAGSRVFEGGSNPGMRVMLAFFCRSCTIRLQKQRRQQQQNNGMKQGSGQRQRGVVKCGGRHAPDVTRSTA